MAKTNKMEFRQQCRATADNRVNTTTLWSESWEFLIKLNIKWPYNPTETLLCQQRSI